MDGGTILDLGIYTIQLCQWVFQQEPESIKATGQLNEDGVDVEMTAELQYRDNKLGKIKTSALDNLSNTAKIIGTKGTITVNAFTNIFWSFDSIVRFQKIYLVFFQNKTH